MMEAYQIWQQVSHTSKIELGTVMVDYYWMQQWVSHVLKIEVAVHLVRTGVYQQQWYVSHASVSLKLNVDYC